jgi:SAM-dependent methyltransferase
MADEPVTSAAPMPESAVRQRVASFPRWHYEFDLNGVRTPIFNRKHVNRHEQRKRSFFAPLLQLCDGSLAGRRVLDLGCNAGFWSLTALEAGAEFVLGLDGRQMHINQANLVFDVKRIAPERYRFEVGDFFQVDLSSEGPFDIVLCLGLLYHVTKPFELVERISAWNSDLLVIDTSVDSSRAELFRVHGQDPRNPRDALAGDLALRPSRRGVASLVTSQGYDSIKMLRPRFSSWQGSRDYRIGTRRAFICSKETPLAGLDAESFSALPPLFAGLRRVSLRKRVRVHGRRLVRRGFAAGRRRRS